MLDLLILADKRNCEDALGRYVLDAFTEGKKASIQQYRERFDPNNLKDFNDLNEANDPNNIGIPALLCKQHQLSDYDNLMEVNHHG